jgi:acetyl esterase/lipase
MSNRSSTAADLTVNPCAKPIPSLKAKLVSPVSVTRFFYGCYVPARIDRRDPCTSPGFAQLVRFPRRILIIMAEWDTLALEAEELAERLRQLPGWHKVSQRMAGCARGWDKNLQLTSPAHLIEAKEQAYWMAVEMSNEK